MSDAPLNTTPDADESDEGVNEASKATSARKSRANPIVGDGTYGELREQNRVVMRHQIALNIDNFRAAPDDFVARPDRSYPALKSAHTPFMSVIIANYNGQDLLPTVFDALARQLFGDFEIIVVDDASTDDSVALVELNYPDVRLLVNRRNVGFVASCNLAADVAAGRVLVMLNSDTEPASTWLEELAKTIVTNPRAAVVASKLMLFDAREKFHSAGDMLGVDGIPRNRGVWEQDRGQFDGETAVFSGCGGASAYRRDVWQTLGGFDEDFWMFVEDVDFAFRARLLGYEAVFAPDALVYHHLSANSGDTLASYYVGRNTIWNIVKNMPRRLLLNHWSEIVNAQAEIAMDALRNIQGDAARERLRGQLAGLIGLPRQLEKRRTIQTQKRVGDERIENALGD